MALVTRLSRLFQADFHAVLDRIEEPDLQFRQAVREMQFALEQDQQHLKLLQHEAEQLGKIAAEANADLTDFDEQLDVCLAAKKDDLARDLIRRKLTAEKRLHNLQQKFTSVECQRQALEKQIDEQVQQMTGMKQKLELLVSVDEGLAEGQLYHADAIRSEEVEIALLHEKQRRVKS